MSLLAILTLNSFQIAQASDINAGKEKSALCATCHGVDGKAAIPSYPNLAGQNEAYLISALKSYRDKQRHGGMSGIMQPQATNLSDTDIENIAAYFASLK